MKLYYFSRGGESEKIARLIAESNHVEMHRIEDKKNWDGKINFLKAGAMASKREQLPIEYQKPCNDEDIVLVFPLWASTFPPAIRSFLQDFDTTKITAVILSAATSLNVKEMNLFLKVYEIKGKDKKPPEELL